MNTIHLTIFKQHLSKKKKENDNPSCVSLVPLRLRTNDLAHHCALASCQRLTQRRFNKCAIVALEMEVIVIMYSQLEM